MFKEAGLLICIMCSFSTLGDKQTQNPTIMSVEIPDMVNRDGTGVYMSLMSKTLGHLADNVEVLPTKRALRIFSSSTNNTCAFPIDFNTAENLGVETKNKLFSKAFNTTFASILSREGLAPLTKLTQIEGKSLGAILGFPVADIVKQSGPNLVTPTSLGALLKMLELGRIDYAYVYFPDILMKSVKFKFEKFSISELRFGVASDALACTKDQAEVIERFNAKVDALYKDQGIIDILGSAYTGR